MPLAKPFIETRGTQYEREKTEEQKRSGYQRTLALHHQPVIKDWTPVGEVEAFISGGRWLAFCPVPDCNSAEYVQYDWPVFVCSASCGEGPLTVIFPRQREQIEAELLKRSTPRTRNWRKGETVANLRRENREHGLD